jgi:FixJ family two-component response regulator
VEERVVCIIDDDPAVCKALSDLLTSHDIRALAFGSASAYIASRKPDTVSCLLLDVNLPDLNGLDLQQKLAHLDHPPIIFITGYADIPSSVQAMKSGAVDFLPKPFLQEDLIRAIMEAFDRDVRMRKARAELADLRSRYSRLTPREREVLPLIVAGLLNKQAAAQLGIAEITCQVHRGQIMRKMAAGSLAELVRMASKLGIPLPDGQETADSESAKFTA